MNPLEMLKYASLIQKELPADHVLVKVAAKLGARTMMGLAEGLLSARKDFTKQQILEGVGAFLDVVERFSSKHSQ